MLVELRRKNLIKKIILKTFVLFNLLKKIFNQLFF